MLVQACARPLIFVQGKGGVGKTTVATALAQDLAKDYRTLLVTIEDPLSPPGIIRKIDGNLYGLNNEAMCAFEEYAGLKIGAPALVRLFLQNKLMQYLARAAPGVRELVLMGKIWHERKNFERIVIDMPATGHGLTMFQAIMNWAQLFAGSVLAKDANAMIETFRDTSQTAHVVISLAEEMPLVESLELRTHLIRILPAAEVSYIANRLFPSSGAPVSGDDHPFSKTVSEHAARKAILETENLEAWKDLKFERIPYFTPTLENSFEKITRDVAAHLAPIVEGASA